jgi:hypothetical protein
VHPAVLDAYLDGSLLETLSRRAEKEMATQPSSPNPIIQAIIDPMSPFIIMTPPHWPPDPRRPPLPVVALAR